MFFSKFPLLPMPNKTLHQIDDKKNMEVVHLRAVYIQVVRVQVFR